MDKVSFHTLTVTSAISIYYTIGKIGCCSRHNKESSLEWSNQALQISEIKSIQNVLTPKLPSFQGLCISNEQILQESFNLQTTAQGNAV